VVLLHSDDGLSRAVKIEHELPPVVFAFILGAVQMNDSGSPYIQQISLTGTLLR